MDIWQ